LIENPQTLKCGHSFCAICIRKNLDKVLNPHRTSTFMQCPSCREKADTSDLIPNRSLAAVCENFGKLRREMLNTLLTLSECNDNKRTLTTAKDFSPTKVFNLNSSSYNLIKKKTPIVKRMPHYSFHGMTKEKIRRTIEIATKDSTIKLRTDGDKEVHISLHTVP